MPDKISVDCVLSSDDNFCQHLAVTIASLSINNPDIMFNIHAVVGELNDVNKNKLSKTCAAFTNINLILYNFDYNQIKDFHIDGHIKLATYFRLFVAEILPKTIDKVLYLDADVVAIGHLENLWGIDIADVMIAGAVDPFSKESSTRLNLSQDHNYINAGVLLINLKNWRERSVGDKFRAFIAKHGKMLRFHDQDVLNSVLTDEILYLDMIWNFQARTRKKDLKRYGLSRADVKHIISDKKIIHYTTNRKPWNFHDDSPCESYYLRYLAHTDWKFNSQRKISATMIISRWTRRGLRRLENARRRLSRAVKSK